MAELIKVTDAVGDVYFEGDYNKFALREIDAEGQLADHVADVEARAAALSAAVGSVTNAVRESFAGMATDKKDGGVLAGIEVEFGLKVSGEGRWFVAKAGAEVNLSVKVSWDFAP